jgi:nitrite reductase/ring-hydroxylating ferredoxin subunit
VLTETEYVEVAHLDDVRIGEIRRFVVDGSVRILVRLEDGVHALDGICTHQHAELAQGEVEDGVLWCPLHGAGYDVATGSVMSSPAVDGLRRYAVCVADGRVLVARDAV